MSCHQCAIAGVSPDTSCATCDFYVASRGFLCGEPFCLDACTRAPIPHGGVCQCGCQKRICDAHAHRHLSAPEHAAAASAVSTCFPSLGTPLSTDALQAGLTMLASHPTEGRSTDAAAALTAFVNIVRPGASYLAAELRRRASDAWREDWVRWARSREVWVELPPAFFGAGTVERVVRIAAREAGAGWRGLVRGDPHEAGRWTRALRPRELRALDALDRRAGASEREGVDDSGPLPSLGELSGLFPPDVPPAEVVRLRAILGVQLPRTPEELARWLTDVTLLSEERYVMA